MNTTTKTLWANVNGVWVDLHIRAYYDSIPVFVGGNFGVDVENGVYSQSRNFSIAKPFTVENNMLKKPTLASNECATLVVNDPIDFSGYTKIKVTTNLGLKELNVSDVNTSGYLYVSVPYDAVDNTIYIGVAVAKQNEIQQQPTNILKRNAGDEVLPGGTFGITEIIVE